MSQVTDKVIANAAGSVVRADLNNVLGALDTSNSGTGEPANKTKGMLWYDSDASSPQFPKLKVYDGTEWDIVWSSAIAVTNAGGITAGSDTDLQFTFGRTKIGSGGTVGNDTMVLAHLDNFTSLKYGFSQTAAGRTHVNCKTGLSIDFHEAGLTMLGRMQTTDTDAFTFKLGANADWKSAPGLKTGFATAMGANERIQVQGTTSAALIVIDSGASADNKGFYLQAEGETYDFAAINDDGTTKRFLMQYDPVNDIMSLGLANAMDLILDSTVIKMGALPTSDPGVQGELWNDSGTVKVSL